MRYGPVLSETMVSNTEVSIAVASVHKRTYVANLSFAGSTMAYELDDTRIESDIGPEIPLQAFAASIDSHNEIHAPPANPSVEGSPRATSVQPDGQNDVLTPLGPEACTTPLPDEGPTAFECCDGQLTSDSSPSLSGARPVLSGGQNFESTVAM